MDNVEQECYNKEQYKLHLNIYRTDILLTIIYSRKFQSVCHDNYTKSITQIHEIGFYWNLLHMYNISQFSDIICFGIITEIAVHMLYLYNKLRASI